MHPTTPREASPRFNLRQQVRRARVRMLHDVWELLLLRHAQRTAGERRIGLLDVCVLISSPS